MLALVALLALTTSCSAVRRAGGPTPPPAPRPSPPRPGGLPGALAGLPSLAVAPTSPARSRLIEAADEVVAVRARPREPLDIESTEDPFVTDAQAAWTLALAHHVTGQLRYAAAAEGIIDAWVTTTRTTRNTCPDSGCQTSLVISRSGPAFVFAVDLLVAGGRYDAGRVSRFHRWLRTVILPAASDRDGNWGDAGTYLRAVVALELGDQAGLVVAADLWRRRIDLIEPDGRIPEEMRRGHASLMYSQEALDYKVATADVLQRAGIDVWSIRGRKGGSLDQALTLVAAGLDDPSSWPAPEADVRVPSPAGLWAIVARRRPSPQVLDLAAEAAPNDGQGHSAVIWTSITAGG